jgi:hypothetical protein
LLCGQRQPGLYSDLVQNVGHAQAERRGIALNCAGSCRIGLDGLHEHGAARGSLHSGGARASIGVEHGKAVYRTKDVEESAAHFACERPHLSGFRLLENTPVELAG